MHQISGTLIEPYRGNEPQTGLNASAIQKQIEAYCLGKPPLNTMLKLTISALIPATIAPVDAYKISRPYKIVDVGGVVSPRI